jgi:hypothetical protein
MIVNLNGLPSAQVHHFDRFDDLLEGWFRKMKEMGWPYNKATYNVDIKTLFEFNVVTRI